jgi:hypothetical protein
MQTHSKKTGLTGSSKKPRRPGRASVARKTAPAQRRDWLDSVDTIHAACATIEMLSGLLAGYGEEPLEAQLAREAGHTLLDHIRQLRVAWNEFTKEGP